MRSSPHTASLGLLVLASLSSCSESSGSPGHAGAPVSWSFVEVERNDTALSANIAGSLYVGDLYTIFGHTTDSGLDPFDGFAFFPGESLELEFTLLPSDPSAVLQICMVDPFGGTPPLCWNTTMTSGVGFATFPAGGELHLVISSLWGDSDYRLEVTAYPPVYAATSGAAAQEAAPGVLGQYLGTPDPLLAELEPAPPTIRGTLVLVDAGGEMHSYPVDADHDGPFVDLGPDPAQLDCARP